MIISFEQMAKDHAADVLVMNLLFSRSLGGYTRATYLWRCAFGFVPDICDTPYSYDAEDLLLKRCWNHNR